MKTGYLTLDDKEELTDEVKGVKVVFNLRCTKDCSYQFTDIY